MTWEAERAARDAEPRCQVCDGPNVDGSGCEHCPAVDPRPWESTGGVVVGRTRELLEDS